MKKTFRVSFGIEELIDNKFLNISNGLEVAIGKEKLLESLDRQYLICKDWVTDNIDLED